MSLYEILGVPAGATPQDIKKAYRKKVQSAHPDREGGSSEEFDKIQKAYDVLSNPSARDRYDKTGETGEGEKSVDHFAEQNLIKMFGEVINDEKFNGNILQLVRKEVQSTQATINSNREQTRERLSRMRKQLGRIRSRGSINLFENLIRESIASLEKDLVNLDQAAQVSGRIIEMLNEYIDTNPERRPDNALDRYFVNAFNGRAPFDFNTKS